MHNEIGEIFRPFKIVGIIGFITFFIVFIFAVNMGSHYDKNYFDIKLNNVSMKCYYEEKYSNGFLIRAGMSGYNNVSSIVNRVDLNDFMNLDIKEYEVYYKNGNRKDVVSWNYNEKFDYKEVYNDINMEIKRMNNVIYNGEYISDLRDYISESGRYYIHIYVTRRDSLISSVKTHISFNVIVGGGNNV